MQKIVHALHHVFELHAELEIADELALPEPRVDDAERQRAEWALLVAGRGLAGARGLLERQAVDLVAELFRVMDAQEIGAIGAMKIEVRDAVSTPKVLENGLADSEQFRAIAGP